MIWFFIIIYCIQSMFAFKFNDFSTLKEEMKLSNCDFQKKNPYDDAKE